MNKFIISIIRYTSFLLYVIHSFIITTFSKNKVLLTSVRYRIIMNNA